MAENSQVLGKDKYRTNGKFIYLFLLFLSFVWCSVYVSVNTESLTIFVEKGNLIDTSSSVFQYGVSFVVSQALVEFLAFEIVFYFYRLFLSFKVYSFVLPLGKLKDESRLFFAGRNVIYGVFVNFCFLYPFLYGYLVFFNLVVTMIMLLYFSKHISKTYSEPVVGHFVFKTFCLPAFFFEIVDVLFLIWGIFL